LFFVVFFRLLIWLLDGKKNKKILPVFFYINPLV
jgi:hypothetical protein